MQMSQKTQSAVKMSLKSNTMNINMDSKSRFVPSMSIGKSNADTSKWGQASSMKMSMKDDISAFKNATDRVTEIR
jgi:hypothetical protein